MSETIHYGALSQPLGLLTRHSRADFETTVSALKAAIEEVKMVLISEIDPQQIMRRDGRAIAPLRQLLFFHPRYMQPLLESDPSAVLLAPLKVIVIEHEDRTVQVLSTAPRVLFVNHPSLAKLAAELDVVVDRILGQVPQ